MTNRNLADNASNPDKSSIVDNDRFPMTDSESNPNTLKEVLWSLVKSTLKSYFDGIYTTTGQNVLINGGFNFAQRQAPGTLTTYAANTYSADRWKTYVENASYQYQRQDGTAESGLTSLNFGAFKKITNTGKMFIYQIVEGANSLPLRGKSVTFQCQMKASSSKTIRMGIFQLQSAGTTDTIPSPIVTAAGANSTDPTMGTNVAVITGAVSKSVTTSMQTFSVNVTIPSTAKNIICAVWTDSQFAANDILYIAEAGLYPTSAVQDWKPRPIAQELVLCQRYLPAFASFTTSDYLCVGEATSTTASRGIVPFLTEARAAPTGITVSASSHFTVQQGGSTVACNSVAFNAATTKSGRVNFDTGSGLTASAVCEIYMNNTSAMLLFTGCELGE